MKSILSLIMLFAAVAPGCSQEKEKRSVGSFTGIRVGQAIDVNLKKGTKESVAIEATGIQLSEVLTEVSGGNLKVYLRNGNYRTKTIKVLVTYVSLEKISASSAANVYCDETIKSDNLDIDASSAGSVELKIDAGDVEIDVSGAGEVRLEGKARKVKVEATTAGDVDAYDLECEIVDADATTAGTIKISVTKELEADASTAGTIRYKGNPVKSNVESSTGGSVKKSN